MQMLKRRSDAIYLTEMGAFIARRISTQSIMVGPDGALYGASDPRSVDDLTAGY
ncbi:hypothetical protein ABR134_005138 [Citrobacter freundii]|nr:hypothetical protein [Citrobacter freundii]